MNLTRHDYQLAGILNSRVGFSDDELDIAIEVLTNIITFFEVRGDAGIILTRLRADLEQFKGYKKERERHGA